MFVNKKIASILMLLFLLFCTSMYIINNGYVNGAGITMDSVSYINEAQALLNGDGLYYKKGIGSEEYFSMFPVGYPLLIALCSLATGTELYVASKILSIIFIALICILLYTYFKEDAWIYALFFVNVGFSNIYMMTWSETMFIPVFLWFSLLLGKLNHKDQITLIDGGKLTIASLLMFSARYIGMISVIIIGGEIIFWLIKKKLNKAIVLLCSNVLNIIFMIGYLLCNYYFSGSFTGASGSVKASITISQFVEELKIGILQEIKNATGFFVTYNDYVAFVVLICVFLFWIFCLRSYIKKHVFPVTPVTTFIVAFMYLAGFLYMKYNAVMDPIGHRFLLPFSFIFYISVAWFLTFKLSKRIKIVVLLLSLMLIGGNYLYPSCSDIKYGKENGKGYVSQKMFWTHRLENVSSGDIVLWACDTGTCFDMVRYLRNDVIFLYPDATLINEFKLSADYKEGNVWIDMDGVIQYGRMKGWDEKKIVENLDFVQDKSGIVQVIQN